MSDKIITNNNGKAQELPQEALEKVTGGVKNPPKDEQTANSGGGILLPEI